MNATGAVVGGLIGGVVGAAVWAGIAYGTGYEVSWIAWGIGGLVGFGCATGGRDRGTASGSIAVVITVLSILAGKYITADLMVRKEIGAALEMLEELEAESQQNDEAMIAHLADEVFAERAEDLPGVASPGDSRDGEVEAPDYPEEVWQEATARWEAMSPDEREDFRASIVTRIRDDLEVARGAFTREAFKGSFGLMDLLFFGLAIVTAYRIAAVGVTAAGSEADGSF